MTLSEEVLAQTRRERSIPVLETERLVLRAPRLGDARNGFCGAALHQLARALRSGCLEILDQQLQLLNLVRALFAAFAILHEAQFADQQFRSRRCTRESLRL